MYWKSLQLGESRIDSMNDAMRNAWSNLVQLMHRAKEAAVELTDPKILSEHLKVIFRDESNAWNSPPSGIYSKPISPSSFGQSPGTICSS